MVTPLFCSFLASYWTSINCNWATYWVWNTNIIWNCLKILLEDGYIESYYVSSRFITVKNLSPKVLTKINWLVLFSWPKWVLHIWNSWLQKITKTGGYYILSTESGLMNDANAWRLGKGGILLLAIF